MLSVSWALNFRKNAIFFFYFIKSRNSMIDEHALFIFSSVSLEFFAVNEKFSWKLLYFLSSYEIYT